MFSNEPGSTDLITHTVITVDDIPVRSRPYRVPHAMRDIVRGELDKMLAGNIIEPANSPYASPIVMVKKPDKSWRFCSDYRKLNAKTVFDAHPMPRVDDLIEKVGNSRFISTLDLAKGYWQIKLDESSKQKSAFVTPFGSFRFNVMPFGMSCAGATFMRLMNKVLDGTELYADSYIDDIVSLNIFINHTIGQQGKPYVKTAGCAYKQCKNVFTYVHTIYMKKTIYNICNTLQTYVIYKSSE